ncbi:exodeoxyribonuclease VII small subunit [Roseomonas xinghualingensis]|uniref:exodeoxyribonuclease VII small subunit n=1 Tax=Roseomonas xinghualingensis TaxID=2986475 RepID=UPI0021F17862|nr:exodeoxyribonuclease VII small subunit [Roseomonas sp. SXEYE001]MCV4208050.1 exodeoxyribonuclease VII small subunit [Roseomonas sp. SXEYE001]
MSDTDLPEVESLSFEEAMAELEAIVRRLEGGQAKLEDAMDSYARGTALRAHCERKLAEAEARVQALVPGPGGPTLRDVE